MKEFRRSTLTQQAKLHRLELWCWCWEVWRGQVPLEWSKIHGIEEARQLTGKFCQDTSSKRLSILKWETETEEQSESHKCGMCTGRDRRGSAESSKAVEMRFLWLWLVFTLISVWMLPEVCCIQLSCCQMVFVQSELTIHYQWYRMEVLSNWINWTEYLILNTEFLLVLTVGSRQPADFSKHLE